MGKTKDPRPRSKNMMYTIALLASLALTKVMGMKQNLDLENRLGVRELSDAQLELRCKQKGFRYGGLRASRPYMIQYLNAVEESMAADRKSAANIDTIPECPFGVFHTKGWVEEVYERQMEKGLITPKTTSSKKCVA